MAGTATGRGPEGVTARAPGARRRRLSQLGALALLSTLAACTAPAGPATSTGAVPETEAVLNLYSWADYFPSSVLRRFEAETGIRVNFSVFDSNDVAETTLSAGHSGFDLVTVNASPHLGRQIPKGLWHRLDSTKLSNRENIDASVLSTLGAVDPGNLYAIPYVWGTTGIIYNPDLIRSLDASAPVDSLGMIFDPRVARRFARCGISTLSSWVDMLPLLSAYLHQHDQPSDTASLEAVGATFRSVKPYIRRVTATGYYEQLARGELCLSIGYSADAMVARRRAAELGTGIRIEFAAPKETVQMYIDAFAIPADARHVAAALRFIDFTLRADVGRELASATGFAVANTAAVAILDPALRDNPIVYPPEDVRARFSLGRAFTMDETRSLARAWLRMKSGQ